MQRYVMELFPGNTYFAADDQGALSCYVGVFSSSVKQCFTIGESRAIPHANDTEQQAQQVAGNPRGRRFSTETPLENADQNSSRADRRPPRRIRNIA